MMSNQSRYPTIGFISFLQAANITLNRSSIALSHLSKPVGFALVQIAGNHYEFIEVLEMFDLEIDRPKLINRILTISESWPISNCFIDQSGTEQNYIWLNGDRLWTRMVASRKVGNIAGYYPRLKPTIRQSDPEYRQRDQLIPRLKNRAKGSPELIFDEQLKASGIAVSATSNFGESSSLDALAGAVEIAAKAQLRFRAELASRVPKGFIARAR